MARLLVDPDRVLHRIADLAALEAYIDTEELDTQHLGPNLKQLCGWAKVGADRKQRKRSGDYCLLGQVTFLYHKDVAQAVVLFGDWSEKHGSFKRAHPAVEMKIDVFKRLASGKRPNGVEGWRLGTIKADILEDGLSLIGLPASSFDDQGEEAYERFAHHRPQNQACHARRGDCRGNAQGRAR